MIHVIATARIKAGKVSEFIDIFKANVPSVLEEEGCIEYLPAVDVDAGLAPQQLDENVITVIEKWESLEALHAHLQSPHMTTYREKVKDIVEDVSLKVLREA
ncbi:MAG: putative quinol monooxygenase [Deltaproteobacteria bacterium]|nr:putative quinol monooxygenase [Deltaproteobacteria bacterium]